jgi:hypothetical protein
MNPPSPSGRHQVRRQATLTQIARLGPFIEGSLSPFKRPGCVSPGWHLTFKKKGRTQTVYVPLDMVPEVKLWTRNHQRLKQLIRKVTRHSLALIRRHVASQRAASRGRPSTRPSRPKP